MYGKMRCLWYFCKVRCLRLSHIAANFGEKLKDYDLLTKSYIDKDGKVKHRSVLCLGELPGFDKDERNRQEVMLTTMIEHE